MIAALLAQAADWIRPDVDWHALAPEIVLIVGINLVLLDRPVDRRVEEVDAGARSPGFVHARRVHAGRHPRRRRRRRRASMFFGRYVVDDYALILKALFLLVGYIVVLMSQTELEEGGYYQGEFYLLLLVSVLGMVIDGVQPRPGLDLRVARTALDPGLHDGRLAQARPQVERGGRQVLPARCVRVGCAAVRHELPVRHDRSARSSPRSARRWSTPTRAPA